MDKTKGTPRVTDIANISGTWVMDKNLSTNLDAVLKLQGISWIMRKAIGAATTTLKITQGSDIDGDRPTWAPTEWMILEPALTGGLEGKPEKRPLTWTDFDHDDTLFGPVIIRSHYISGQRVADGRVQPLVEPFTKVAAEDAGSILREPVVVTPEIAGSGVEELDKAFIHDFVRSAYSGWTAEQMWAVEMIGEELFLTRRVVVWKGSYAESACVYYRRVWQLV